MKILAAMSGGVDSSVAAAVLVRAGHDVSGVYMKNWINEENIIGHCPWEEDITDAEAVAKQLGIPFRVVNLMTEYREKVVKYLLEGYQAGITPNPDVMCNREMKFGVLWEWAREHGFAAIATGHYARKLDAGTILRGVDPNKDQTYFLAMMQPEQVRIAQFPIGHLLKPELRDLAREFGLSTAEKKDSQGICFIGQVKMEDFLRTFVPDKPGPIVNLEGKVMGEHRGLHLYTLGQRKGHGVASPIHKQAYVVVAKRPQTNELVVAIENADTPLLWARKATLHTISSTGVPLTEERLLQAQPRYRCPAGNATFRPLGDGRAELEYAEPQRALTPGQICALYDGERLLGGAVFEAVHHESS
ncbi:tRNA 2-thiouridine(34) synthase MnmA [Prosthecobacter vanneervenii]|uniref:tRNA-specific 2-thiouridylase MnmA n=1 Tax=Prosthecobacter vanneervenii TaxID=48466 RepID=A0A7W7Y6Y3_9BACT|nr:tRNA 2-thiouridine(34) synthase MnmA [Prosthecobacter vanneervenii]MBB5030736.1 tRNA-specific 2-thiouridylase [Prosthecobacter vanneervenii]